MTTEPTNIETEGGAREYVEANTDEAVHIVADDGAVYLFVDDEGAFDVTLEWDDGRVESGPILGDDFEFPDSYTVEGTIPVDEVPERNVEEHESPLEELLSELEEMMEEADADGDEVRL